MPGQLDVISASVAQHHAIFGAFHPLQYSMSPSIAPTVCLWTIGKQRRQAGDPALRAQRRSEPSDRQQSNPSESSPDA